MFPNTASLEIDVKEYAVLDTLSIKVVKRFKTDAELTIFGLSFPMIVCWVKNLILVYNTDSKEIIKSLKFTNRHFWLLPQYRWDLDFLANQYNMIVHLKVMDRGDEKENESLWIYCTD